MVHYVEEFGRGWVGKDGQEYKMYPHSIDLKNPEAYKGSITDWKIEEMNEDLNPMLALIDMLLYYHPSKDTEPNTLSDRLENSEMFPQYFRRGITELSDNELEDLAEDIVEWIWLGDHFWGNLLTDVESNRVFVKQYLFRMLHQLSTYDNVIEEQNLLHGKTCEDLIDTMENMMIKKNHKRFDEWLIEHGFSSLPKEDYKYERIDKDICVEQVSDKLRDFVKNEKEFHQWAKIIQFANTLEKAVLYGNFKKVPPRHASTASEISLSVQVISNLADELHEMHVAYNNEDLAHSPRSNPQDDDSTPSTDDFPSSHETRAKGPSSTAKTMTERTKLTFDDRYEFRSEGADEGVLMSYKGAKNDWQFDMINKKTIIPALVDATLYQDFDGVSKLKTKFRESEFKVEQVKDMIRTIDYHTVDIHDKHATDQLGRISRDITAFVMGKDNHHWGKLLTTYVSDREFVEDYLFRFLFHLKSVQNAVDDGHVIINNDSYKSFHLTAALTTGKETDDGRTFDEFLVEESVIPQNRRLHENSHLHLHQGRAFEELQFQPDVWAAKPVREMILNMRKNIDTYTWSDIIERCDNIGKAVVFSKFRAHAAVSDKYPVNRMLGLAECVIDEIGQRLAELYEEFQEEVD